jgi:hypothetical protein
MSYSVSYHSGPNILHYMSYIEGYHCGHNFGYYMNEKKAINLVITYGPT